MISGEREAGSVEENGKRPAAKKRGPSDMRELLHDALLLLFSAVFFAGHIAALVMCVRSGIHLSMNDIPLPVSQTAAETEVIQMVGWATTADGTVVEIRPVQDEPVSRNTVPAQPAPMPQPEAPAQEEASETTEEEAAAPSPPRSSGEVASMGEDGAWTMLVWIGNSDPCYHSLQNCENADLSDGRQVSVQEAVAIGRRKCDVCWLE